jgi:uncharacterized membrane protein
MSRPETLALNRFPAETPAGREPWLDVLRGVAVAGMIVVNNPGSWDHVYWPLLHAPWHGWTGADLIFPLFLFIVGVSMSFALFCCEVERWSLALEGAAQGDRNHRRLFWR